jgi:hypothetical protein
MRVVEKPRRMVRIRIDAFEDGKNVPGGEAIHLADTTVSEVYLRIAKALGLEDDLLKLKQREEAYRAKAK